LGQQILAAIGVAQRREKKTSTRRRRFSVYRISSQKNQEATECILEMINDK